MSFSNYDKVGIINLDLIENEKHPLKSVNPVSPHQHKLPFLPLLSIHQRT